MAEDRQVTPEKQLLNLIEDPLAMTKGAAVQKARVKRAGAGLLSWTSARGALFGWLSFFKRSTQKQVSRTKFTVSFKTANRVLLLVSVGLFIYLAADTFASAVSLMHPPNFVLQKDQSIDLTPEKMSPLKDELYYTGKASSRNIFGEFKEPAAKKGEKPAAQSADNNEAIKALSLVGISWSASPDAIVEDKTKQKTYFLKRGQEFGDGIKVEAIFKNKVVLSLDDQEFELK